MLDYNNYPHLKIYGLTSQFDNFQPIQIRDLSSGCWYVFAKFWQFFCPVRKQLQGILTMAHTVHGPSPCKKISVFWRYSGGCTTSHISSVKNIKGTVYTFARVWMSRPQESCGRDTYSIPIDYCPFSILNKTYVAYGTPTRVPSNDEKSFA